MQTQIDNDQWIPGPEARRLVGGISSMTEFRWRRDRGFPAPAKVGARNFYRKAEVVAWMRRHEAAEAVAQ